MKKNILPIVCVLLLLVAFCLNAFMLTSAEKNAAPDEGTAALSTDRDKLQTAVAALYKRAGNLVLSLPYASINLSQTAAMKAFAGEKDGALSYLNARADTYLGNAYDMMDDILSDYDAVIAKYNGESYKSKRSELATVFSGLESSCNELIRRTRTFVEHSQSGYDSYYTAYCEQLQIVGEKLESASSTIDSRYDALISELLGSDYQLVY